MEFRFEGYIREIGPLETITFKDQSVHNKREIIVTTDEQKPKSLGFVFWDNDALRVDNFVPKQYISVDYNCKATFEKGKNGPFLKNTLTAWRFQLGQVNPNLQWAEATIPAYQPAPAAPAGAAAQQAAAQQAYQQQQVYQQAAPQQIPAPQVALQVNGLPNPVMLNPNQSPF